ncbi:MAG TPA: helix-turn-helix domain-containing protein, partial [Candidatus Bipolaricaulota bacterium]
SRADLAELAGISTETAIRTLSRFKDQGMIALDGSKIFLVDKERLTKLAEPFLVALKENLL